MPRLLPRQAPTSNPPLSRDERHPACIACGNRRMFWVKQNRESQEFVLLNA